MGRHREGGGHPAGIAVSLAFDPAEVRLERWKKSVTARLGLAVVLLRSFALSSFWWFTIRGRLRESPSRWLNRHIAEADRRTTSRNGTWARWMLRSSIWPGAIGFLRTCATHAAMYGHRRLILDELDRK
jgi:hypothetical protein